MTNILFLILKHINSNRRKPLDVLIDEIKSRYS